MSLVKKCLVWDLDNTVWDGICLEGRVKPRPQVKQIITTLDQRGIIHSIASRNEPTQALRLLQKHGLRNFFIAPQINWLPKSTNIIKISEQLNLPLDSIAFIDDEPFEREQVAFMLPDVMTIAAEEAGRLSEMPAFHPGYTTIESRSRRDYYLADMKRRKAENKFSTREAFLISCRMQLSIRSMLAADIDRVSELMTRTHQLNTTGLVFEYEKLVKTLTDEKFRYQVYVAELTDKFGTSGIIGTAVAEITAKQFRIIFFTLSCRILGRGIERSFLSWLAQNAREKGYGETEALYKKTGRNSMMRALYQMSGFSVRSVLTDHTLLFTLDNKHIPVVPKWVKVL